MRNFFRITTSVTALLVILVTIASLAQVPGKIKQTGQILLPNGWKLSPAGRSIQLGDLPLNMQLSSSGKYLAITNNGQSTQSLQLVDPQREKVLDEQELDKSWYGLAFSSDEKHLYVSSGNDNTILIFEIKNNKLRPADTIVLGAPWPKGKISPAGIVVTKDNSRLYTVTKEDSCIYIIDLKKNAVINKIQLPTIAYSCALSADEKTLYTSLWGGEDVAMMNTETESITGLIKTGSHPNELLLNKKGTLLYVANANDNSVSIINTSSNKVIETVSTSLYPTILTGSTTNGLALSPNEKTLYIANADNNCLAVFDVSVQGNSKSQGFIPVGWYPTNVKVLGNKIMVSNGKGETSLPNPEGPQPMSKADNSGYQTGSTANAQLQYIAGLFKGTLSFIEVPNEDKLKAYTKQVYANTPFTDKRTITADGETGNPIPRKQGEKSPIKHVFYIIKENRTYDQVLGDMHKGNGDKSLCLFGEGVTPNHHALADEFVLMDNFYVDAEVSADGHNWSMAAYASDVVEKTWPSSYGKRGGTGNYEGGRPATYPRDGFIWDYCKHGFLIELKNAQYCRVTDCTFTKNTAKDQFMPIVVISGKGDHNRVDHCNFISNVDNQELQVKITADAVPLHSLIDHNIFKDKAKVSWKVSNGGECVQIGQDPVLLGTQYAYTTVRDNRFIHCDAEAEVISNKSSGNQYINNYFENCDGELVMRGGHDCLIDSNTFKGGTGGIRVNGTHHTITNNTLNGLPTGIRLMYGMAKGKTEIGFYIAASDCLIKNNHIANTTTGILIGDSKNADWNGKFDTTKYPSRTMQDVAPFNNSLIDNIITGTKNSVVHNEN